MKHFFHANTLLTSACLLLWCGIFSFAQQTNLLTGSKEIKQGDKGFIAWRFQDYETVQIVGDTLRVIRSARDMLTIQPGKTTTFTITALGKGKPRLDTLWRVRVLTLAEADSIALAEANAYTSVSTNTAASRGGQPETVSSSLPESIYLVSQASTLPSEYYAGIVRNANQNSNEISAKKIQIVRIPDNSLESASLHAVVLDAYGNFLPSFAQQPNKFSLSLFGIADSLAYPQASLSSDVVFSMREASLYDSPNLALTVCVDESASMKRFSGVEQSALDFMRSLGGRVEKQILAFDHRVRVVNPLDLEKQMDLDKQKQALEPRSEQGGLTALYKAAYKGLLTLKQSGRRHKALVLISGGKDDASILYTMHDVMRSAKEFGVVIYTIAIGSNADTYTLRQMAEFTGGRFYAVNDDAMKDLPRVLKEISLSYKAFYELVFSSGTKVQAHSAVIDATLSFKTSDNRTLSETKPFALSEKNVYSTHQIVATFAPNSFQPDALYDQQVSSLAQVLKDNPEKVIELVGHTDMQGNDGINRNFALRRAQAVKSRLVSLGANTMQIRLRSVGREKPVYYFESEEWQSRVNRRVELRWLDPTLVPYEILAEAVASEEEAMRLEAQWSARGYDAYYDAFLINRIPAYRLKLWGFATLESAEKTKNLLQQQYRLPLKVQ
ncbi:MAG: OmpA family protein [Candidatus Kapabacteria bacterium]|jgi:outer membrane protein OmpA-like peptidoglycan-associated protein|nr:OmpA family protein [Candidatus Kapabacteria bacterium]